MARQTSSRAPARAASLMIYSLRKAMIVTEILGTEQVRLGLKFAPPPHRDSHSDSMGKFSEKWGQTLRDEHF